MSSARSPSPNSPSRMTGPAGLGTTDPHAANGQHHGRDGWTTCIDESTGESYYWNTITNQVTWSNPYAANDHDSPSSSTSAAQQPATRVLPGSAPTAATPSAHSYFHDTHPPGDADELNAIHPSRRAFFTGGGGADPSHPSSSATQAATTAHYNAAAASHLDLLLHSIDRAKAGDTQSLVDTVSSEKSLSSAMTNTASSIRPTAVTGGGSHLSGPSLSDYGYGLPGVGGAGGDGSALQPPPPSAKSLNNLYFDEQAYQDQRNMEKALEAVYGKEKRKRLTKSELDKFKTKKEQQKKKKYLSKFENM